MTVDSNMIGAPGNDVFNLVVEHWTTLQMDLINRSPIGGGMFMGPDGADYYRDKQGNIYRKVG